MVDEQAAPGYPVSENDPYLCLYCLKESKEQLDSLIYQAALTFVSEPQPLPESTQKPSVEPPAKDVPIDESPGRERGFAPSAMHLIEKEERDQRERQATPIESARKLPASTELVRIDTPITSAQVPARRGPPNGPPTLPNTDGVLLGNDVKTGEPIRIDDEARRSGLYVVGRSGTGKTGLLIGLMEQDIKNGHGLFLLDPHEDALQKVLERGDGDRLANAIILDPADDTHRFGINLLACKNAKSQRLRDETFAKAKAVCDKFFYPENEVGGGLYYNLVIENSLRALIENQEYTIVEVPLFLQNAPFREHVLQKVVEEHGALDYWRYEFPKKEDEQRRLIEPLVNRLNLLKNIADIVGQRETTIDFTKIIAERRIVLVKLPKTLSPEARRFIGTVLVSELVSAAEGRKQIPQRERHQFCVFVDEFQTFVAVEDLQKLFAEARKWALRQLSPIRSGMASSRIISDFKEQQMQLEIKPYFD